MEMEEQKDVIGADNGSKKVFVVVNKPPEWLTQEYFSTNVLQTYEKDANLKVTEYCIEAATKPGDNFASVVFRVKASYVKQDQAKEDQRFIVKVEPFVEGIQMDAITGTPFFDTEIEMYTRTLPEMQRLLKSVGDDEIIGPELIYTNSKPKIVVLRDISPDGYEMTWMPLDVATTEMVAKKLGKFHAVSYFMNENHDDVASYRNGMFSESMTHMVGFLKKSFDTFADNAGTWGGAMEKVAAKMQVFKEQFVPKMMQIYKGNAPGQGYNVLNHGDFHVKNLLFRKSDSDPTVVESVRFIDFQISVYSTPAIDLCYLIYLVGNQDVHAVRDQILRVYHDEFLNTLTRLGHLKAPPSMMDLQVEVLRSGLMDVYLSIVGMPMFYMDVKQMQESLARGVDMADMDAMWLQMYDNPELRKHLSEILVKCMRKGYID